MYNCVHADLPSHRKLSRPPPMGHRRNSPPHRMQDNKPITFSPGRILSVPPTVAEAARDRAASRPGSQRVRMHRERRTDSSAAYGPSRCEPGRFAVRWYRQEVLTLRIPAWLFEELRMIPPPYSTHWRTGCCLGWKDCRQRWLCRVLRCWRHGRPPKREEKIRRAKPPKATQSHPKAT